MEETVCFDIFLRESGWKVTALSSTQKVPHMESEIFLKKYMLKYWEERSRLKILPLICSWSKKYSVNWQGDNKHLIQFTSSTPKTQWEQLLPTPSTLSSAGIFLTKQSNHSQQHPRPHVGIHQFRNWPSQKQSGNGPHRANDLFRQVLSHARRGELAMFVGQHWTAFLLESRTRSWKMISIRQIKYHVRGMVQPDRGWWRSCGSIQWGPSKEKR